MVQLRDKKEIYFLSTIHKAIVALTGKTARDDAGQLKLPFTLLRKQFWMHLSYTTKPILEQLVSCNLNWISLNKPSIKQEQLFQNLVSPPLTGFLTANPTSEKKTSPRGSHKKGIRKESWYQCKNCHCPAPCFENFYTTTYLNKQQISKKHYWSKKHLIF